MEKETENMVGYFKKDNDGKEYFVFDQSFQIKVETENPDSKSIFLIPSFKHSMMIYEQATLAKVPSKIDSYDIKEEMKDRKKQFKKDVATGMIEDEYAATIDMVLDIINNDLNHKYFEAQKQIKQQMEEYAKCYLWSALGFNQYPLLRKADGTIEGLKKGYELKIALSKGDNQ